MSRFLPDSRRVGCKQVKHRVKRYIESPIFFKLLYYEVLPHQTLHDGINNGSQVTSTGARWAAFTVSTRSARPSVQPQEGAIMPPVTTPQANEFCRRIWTTTRIPIHSSHKTLGLAKSSHEFGIRVGNPFNPHADKACNPGGRNGLLSKWKHTWV